MECEEKIREGIEEWSTELEKRCQEFNGEREEELRQKLKELRQEIKLRKMQNGNCIECPYSTVEYQEEIKDTEYGDVPGGWFVRCKKAGSSQFFNRKQYDSPPDYCKPPYWNKKCRYYGGVILSELHDQLKTN